MGVKKLLDNYKTLGRKEFFNRWKQGIEGINPLQQTKAQMNSTLLVLIGIVAGFIVSLFSVKNLWWLSIILLGAFFNTLIQYLGMWQKKNTLKNLGLYNKKGGQLEIER